MSEENVEVVRRAWKAHVRRDNEAALGLYLPEIEIDLSGGQKVGDRFYYGFEGVQQYIRDWVSVFGDFTTDVDEWVDAGDQVIAIVHSCGRGRRSGVPVDMREAHLWTVREGKLRRLQTFATRADALEAAGLSE
jgi:ketosteroid isomerase-like protein